MVVLGLNGWINNVHDPAAALFVEGRLVAAVEEERLNRRKHAFDVLPHRAIEACLRSAGVTVNELDEIILGWDLENTIQSANSAYRNLTNKDLLELYLPKGLFKKSLSPNLSLKTVNHHKAHAAGSFASSPFDEACVIITDGFGEKESITIFYAHRKKGVKRIQTLPISESLGMFYLALTQFLGFAPFQEGRTMGLAAYGDPCYQINRNIDLTKDQEEGFVIDADALGREVVNGWIKEFCNITGGNIHQFQTTNDSLTGLATYSSPTVEQRNIAASGQVWIEEQLSRLVAHAVKLTSCSNVVIAGGVALNCSANQKLHELEEVSKLYVPPTPGDAGVSLGAACYLYGMQDGIPWLGDEHVYSGVSFTNSEIADDLKRCGVSFVEADDIDEYVASALAQEKNVARFNGKMEFGPRALGHRSILASPKNLDIRSKLNQIKGREQWRPVSPVVLEESRSRYFKDAPSSPFMSYSPECLPYTTEIAPAAVHADGTARLQTVSKNNSSSLRNVIETYEKYTGIGMILNTSFNIGPEPIVATPRQALRSFFASELDILAIGPFIVEKRGE